MAAAAPPVAAAGASAHQDAQVKSFELDEKTIAELQEMMSSGKLHVAFHHGELPRPESKPSTSRGQQLSAVVIEENPDALAMADVCDKERPGETRPRPTSTAFPF